MMKKLTFLTLPLFLLVACDDSDGGLLDDVISTSTLDEDIDTDTTLSGGVTVSGVIDVRADLTLAPGTTLFFEQDAGLLIQSNGSITANGNASARIRFTGESSATWDAVVIASSSANSFDFCDFDQGGGGSSFGLTGNETAQLIVRGEGRASVQNSTFARSGGVVGVSFRDGAQIDAFANNNFGTSGDFAVRLFANEVGSIDATSTYGSGVVDVLDADIVDGATWEALDVPYRVNGIVDVEMANATEGLTVATGAEIAMATDAGIDVRSGFLALSGSVRGEVETAGYWQAIVFATNNPSNTLDGANVAHGGGGTSFGFTGNDNASIIVQDNARATLNNTTVRDSMGEGLRVREDGNITVTSSTFNSNGGPGVRLYARHLTQLTAGSTFGGAAGFENGDPWIDVLDSDVEDDGTWLALDAPYRINGLVDIENSATITVSAGAELRMGSEAGINVLGALDFMGTSGSTILVTGEVAIEGYWEALVFNSVAGNAMDYVIVEYGGAATSFGFSGNTPANVLVRNGAAVAISNSTIRNSADIGVATEGTGAVIPADPTTAGDNTFSDNIRNFVVDP